jgi:hypothetical protein
VVRASEEENQMRLVVTQNITLNGVVEQNEETGE